MAYSFVRSITIRHAEVPNTDRTNYPFCFAGTYSWLADFVHGGESRSQFGGVYIGWDIVFAADSAGTIPLTFERNFWDGTTGQCEFHVLVPTVSHTVDTVIYILYSDTAITTDPANPNGVWDSNYKAVIHTNFLGGSNTNSGFNDSTSNGNTLTGNGQGLTPPPQYNSSGGPGIKHLYAGFFGENNASLNSPASFPSGAATRTLEMWYKLTGASSANMAMGGWGTNTTDQAFFFDYIASNGVPSLDTYNNGDTFGSYDNSWHYIAATLPSGSTLGSVQVYLDGALASVTPHNAGGGLNTSTAHFTLGKVPDGAVLPTFWLDGGLSEIRVSSGARSADYFATHYNNITLGDIVAPYFYIIGPVTPRPTIRPYIFVVT